MSETTALLPEALTTAAASVPKRGYAFYSRILKLSLATLVAGIGGIAALNEGAYITTSEAVVSSYLLEVRTPVEGTVSGLPHTIGHLVQAGEVLGSVANPLVDRQHLDSLRESAVQATSAVQALEEETSSLTAQRKRLLSRTGQHTAVLAERLQQQIEEAKHTLAARQVAEAEAGAELRRGQQMFASGLIARAELDKLEASHRGLVEQVASDHWALQAIQTEADAARHGVLAEVGGNSDVTYSMQRADELETHLAANQGSLATARTEAAEARQVFELESAREGQLANSPLIAPSAGTVWRLGAVNGERLAAGSSVLSLADCEHQFVVAEISQSSMEDVAPNSTATLRFAGESFERKGTVSAVWSDTLRDSSAKLAVAPVTLPSDHLATVLIRLNADAVQADTSCQIGRAVHVRIARSGAGLLPAFFRR